MPHEIPARWADAVRRHVLRTTGEARDHLLAHDFGPNRSVRLGFPDGSFALFRYAFYLQDDAGCEVAVFTEHCGYHFFPADELEVETLASAWDDHEADTGSSDA